MSTKKFSREEELARELSKRGMSRRQMLKVGALLGLGSASMAALAACAPPAVAPAAPKAADAPKAEAPAAEPAKSIFDAGAGADGKWPKSVVADPAAEVTLSVAHAWDATFMERQRQFDELFTKRHPNIKVANLSMGAGTMNPR